MDERDIENLLRASQGPTPRPETTRRILECARKASDDRAKAAMQTPAPDSSGHRMRWLRFPLAAAAAIGVGIGLYLTVSHLRTSEQIPGPDIGSATPIEYAGWSIVGRCAATTIETDIGPQQALRADELASATGQDGSKIHFAAGSVFALPVADAGDALAHHVQVIAGQAWFDVQAQPAGKRFVVTTEAANIEVVGTEFMVQVEQKGNNMTNMGRSLATIALFTGALQVVNPHGQIELLAGDVAMATEETAPQKAVEGLASQFGKHYEPIEVGVEPAIPPYELPLARENVGNYAHVIGKLPQDIQADERLLAQNGFVATTWARTDDFTEAYKAIRDMEVPVYVTSDSVLHMYHLQFGELLSAIEQAEFVPQLTALSKAMINHVTSELDDLANRDPGNTMAIEALQKALAFCAVGYEMLIGRSDEIEALKRFRDEVASTENWGIESVWQLKEKNKTLHQSIVSAPEWEDRSHPLNPWEVPHEQRQQTMLKFLDHVIAGRDQEAESASLALPEPVRGWVDHDLSAALAHEGYAKSPIFDYMVDFSQYVPRGHYTRGEDLKRYFRAMMWFGRMTFLVKGGEPNGPLAPDYLVSADEARRQTMAACCLTRAIKELKIGDENAIDIWQRIYGVTAFFVGLADDLTCREYDFAFTRALGNDYRPEMLSDEASYNAVKLELARLRRPAIYSGTGGSGTLDSDVLAGKPNPRELDKVLAKTQGYRLMGQRFIPDSYAMGKLVSPTIGKYTGSIPPKNVFTADSEQPPLITRVFPRGLDVMALLGSNRAEAILTETGDSAYAGYDEAFDKLAGEFAEISEPVGWNINLYWSWLYSLKALLGEYPQGYQAYMTLPAWQDKQLNTALGSWSQLRHDTILYGKQSYTMRKDGVLYKPGDFPGYVEPVPELYARLLALTRMTNKVLTEMKVLDALDEKAKRRLEKTESILDMLLTLSRKELQNESLTQAEYGWINDFTSELKATCTGLGSNAISTTLIADVHTDQNGGCVLEEGTGYLAVMLVANRLPNGQIGLAAGPVFTYYEFKHPMSDRLTNESWRLMLQGSEDHLAGRKPAFANSYFTIPR